MALKKQLSITVVNQAGEGAKLCALLKEAGINIEAISVCEFTEGGVVRMVPDDDREAARLYGILRVDAAHRVVNFVEKPADPPTTLAAIVATG